MKDKKPYTPKILNPSDKIHLSYSSISQYEFCPFQWYLLRKLKVPQNTGWWAIWLERGSCVHNIIHSFYNRTMRRSSEIEPSTVKEIFKEELQISFENYWTIRSEKITEGAEHVLELMLRRQIEEWNKYRDTFFPVLAEKRLEVIIGGVRVITIPDKVVKRDGYQIHDYKFSQGGVPLPVRQLNLYRYSLLKNYDIDTDMFVHYLKDDKIIPIPREDNQVIEDWVENAAEKIKHNHFPRHIDFENCAKCPAKEACQSIEGILWQN